LEVLGEEVLKEGEIAGVKKLRDAQSLCQDGPVAQHAGLPVEPVMHVKEVEGTSLREQLSAGAEKVGAGVQGGEVGGPKGVGTFKRSKVRREGN
jgi:hypothetical protein